MRLHVFDVTLPSYSASRKQEIEMPTATIGTHFGPGCDDNGELVEDFGICVIQVEEDGAVFEQGINDTALAVE